MATVWYLSHGFIHKGTTFMYLQYSISPYLSHNLLPNVWKTSYTISAFIFVDVPYWPPYNADKFISCATPCPSHWFFYFRREIVIQQGNKELNCVVLHVGSSCMEIVLNGIAAFLECFNPLCNCAIWQRYIAICFMPSLNTFLCTTTRATSILIQQCCSSYVNMVLCRSHYPYESQRSTHCSRLTEYCCCWLH